MVIRYSSGKISVKCSKNSRILVDDVNFDIDDGETFALIGKTGSGKTMIALSIMNLLPEDAVQTGGKFDFCGRFLTGESLQELLGNEIVYIPQSGGDYLNPTRTVKKQLADSLKRLGFKGKDIKNRAIENLGKAGLSEPEKVMELYPFELSGGMAQRVTIALALCSNAKLLICDEATNGLNHEATKEFIFEINRLFPKASKLVITHDISVAKSCDKIGVLCEGKLLERGDAQSVLVSPKHPYTKSLINSLVKNGMEWLPILRNDKCDCPFYSRCPSASERCLSEVPQKTDGVSMYRCVL